MTVSKHEDFLLRASEAEQKAEAAQDNEIKQLYFDLAHQWRELARQAMFLADAEGQGSSPR